MRRLPAAWMAVAACATFGLGLSWGTREARADAPAKDEAPARKAVLAPTLVGPPGSLHKATEKEADLRALSGQIDAQLSDAAQDLGMMIDVGLAPGPELGRASEPELSARARELGAVVFVPTLRAEDGGFVVRIAAFDPGGKAMFVRTERATRGELALHAVVLLRDLTRDLGSRGGPRPASAAAAPASAPTKAPELPPVRSAGRAPLLVNATLFGGLMGFSVQKASGSDDPRILYPLLAVGAGIGLGGAIIITEEWDITPSDAWYLSAGMWWPTLAGQLIFAGRFDTFPDEDRWEFGLIGGTTGLAMASLGVALRPMTEGGAWLAHSGGALGVVFGGLGEMMGRGTIHTTPFAGMGYGAGVGWLVAAAAATQIRPTPTQVLAIDVGALVGGLGGAALASPLVFGKQDDGKQRAWVGVTGGAALAGGAASYLLFGREKGGDHPGHSATSAALKASWLVPEPGVLGESYVAGARAPIVGLAWRGVLDADGAPHAAH